MQLSDLLEKNVLRSYRLRKNYCQWHLSLLAQVSTSRISQIESGAPAKDFEKGKLANALGVTVSDIWHVHGATDMNENKQR